MGRSDITHCITRDADGTITEIGDASLTPSAGHTLHEVDASNYDSGPCKLEGAAIVADLDAEAAQYDNIANGSRVVVYRLVDLPWRPDPSSALDVSQRVQWWAFSTHAAIPGDDVQDDVVTFRVSNNDAVMQSRLTAALADIVQARARRWLNDPNFAFDSANLKRWPPSSWS